VVTDYSRSLVFARVPGDYLLTRIYENSRGPRPEPELISFLISVHLMHFTGGKSPNFMEVAINLLMFEDQTSLWTATGLGYSGGKVSIVA
jgi:hypothetical protein